MHELVGTCSMCGKPIYCREGFLDGVVLEDKSLVCFECLNSRSRGSRRMGVCTMPWPMVHFSIAEQLWNQNPSPEFLLGSIAPDAIHMREGTTRQDKGHTHLCDDDGTMPNLTDFDNFYRKYRSSNDHSFNQFLLGYISHIFTDLRWTETVWKDYVEKASGEFVEQNETLKDRYNKEVCQIEYHLCRSENWTDRVLSSLLQAKAYSVPSLLQENEVKQYGEHVVRNLRDTSNEPHIALCYITDQIVTEFIERSVHELRGLVRIWERTLHLDVIK